jgi:hypothetical protein
MVACTWVNALAWQIVPFDRTPLPRGFLFGSNVCKQLQAWNVDSLKESLNDLQYWQVINGCRLTTKLNSTIVETHLKRAKHPTKEIEAALRFAESEKWRVLHHFNLEYAPRYRKSCLGFKASC